MQFQDYYETLGIRRGASPDEVKTAFRGLARKHHPDVNPGDPSAERRFRAINEAYEVLRDPQTRRKYDALGANWKQYEQAAAAGRDPFAGRSPFAGGWRVPGAAGSAPFRSGTRHPLDTEGDGDPFGAPAFSEFFRTFFAGAPPAGAPGAGSKRTPAGRGPTVELPLELTLEEAFAGVTRRLAAGTGERPKAVEVRIPAGVADGSRVRVAGRGAPGPAGAGDLLLRVRIAPHPVFARRGRDLTVRCGMPLTTAVLGGEVDVSAVDGGTVRLKVPPGTQQGQTFRIRGRGMPSPRADGGRGDLYATAHVEIPRRLSAEAQRHFEALAALSGDERGGRHAPPRPAAPSAT
ncbi:MAG: J domain-containing protein [Acidobacteria bacterium]|nr:J domain-containing protein [Acidobacteriota bacterium]